VCVVCMFKFCHTSTGDVHKSSYIVCLIEVNGKGNVGRHSFLPQDVVAT
jgi:hypothetical protein